MVFLQTPRKGLPYALVFTFRGKEDFPGKRFFFR